MKAKCVKNNSITIRDYIKGMDDRDLLIFLSLYDEEIPYEERYDALCTKCTSPAPCEASKNGKCPYGDYRQWWINQPVESSRFFRSYFLPQYDDNGYKIVCPAGLDSNKVQKTLAKRISMLRTGTGESQQHLADSLEVSRETVKFWENGDRQIKAPDLAKLALHYGVSVDYLLGLKTETGE